MTRYWSSVQFNSTVGLGSIVSITIILAFVGGVVAWGYRLFRKIDRITELAQTVEKVSDNMEEIADKLNVIGEQSKLWRVESQDWRRESAQWHTDHIRHDHGIGRGQS